MSASKPVAAAPRRLYARQAITTKYIGPTNHRPGRIKATCDAMSVTIEWAHEKDMIDNHAAAARELAARLGWDGAWHVGGLARSDRSAYVFVQISDPDTCAFVDVGGGKDQN